MHIPQRLQTKFANALADMTENASQLAKMVRGTANPDHGDYQANCAMPLSKQLGKRDPTEVANEIVSRLKVDDLCDAPEVVRGFINLRLTDQFINESLLAMLSDDRCLIPPCEPASRILIDFSSPNVAKPMHVGHIRSTVIGDSLAKTLGFLGHQTITDNHLGDWGTQFGIIIFGYKHFGDPSVVDADPVPELTKLYRLVNQLVDYRKAVKNLEPLRQSLGEAEMLAAQAKLELEQADSADKKATKKKKKASDNAQRKVDSVRGQIKSTEETIRAVESDPKLNEKAQAYPTIDSDVLNETAKLHEGDPENIDLWKKFMPFCQDEINRIYRRLNITFDHTLGESFYHPLLAEVVEELERQGLATESDGATCVFIKEFATPMIVRKKDGAFLYATTDLATLKYRLAEFAPNEILYVVDKRQSEHFEKLFAVSDHFGLQDIKLVHVQFGTVSGPDGKPIKTRSGSVIGLEGLLDDAVERAKEVVCNPERLATFDPPMDEKEQAEISEVVGIGAIKFADLSHHRTSDYKFDLNKMIALEGNTSTYVQYQYTRTQGILRRNDKTDQDVCDLVSKTKMELTHPAERALALKLLQMEEALQAVHQDYAPNHLVDYLLETAKAFSVFNDRCHVLHAESKDIQTTRLALVVICGRVLRTGLSLLGIDVVQRM